MGSVVVVGGETRREADWGTSALGLLGREGSIVDVEGEHVKGCQRHWRAWKAAVGGVGSVVAVQGVDAKGAVSHSGVGENVVVGGGWKFELEGVDVSLCEKHRCGCIW